MGRVRHRVGHAGSRQREQAHVRHDPGHTAGLGRGLRPGVRHLRVAHPAFQQQQEVRVQPRSVERGFPFFMRSLYDNTDELAFDVNHFARLTSYMLLYVLVRQGEFFDRFFVGVCRYF